MRGDAEESFTQDQRRSFDFRNYKTQNEQPRHSQSQLIVRKRGKENYAQNSQNPSLAVTKSHSTLGFYQGSDSTKIDYAQASKMAQEIRESRSGGRNSGGKTLADRRHHDMPLQVFNSKKLEEQRRNSMKTLELGVSPLRERASSCVSSDNQVRIETDAGHFGLRPHTLQDQSFNQCGESRQFTEEPSLPTLPSLPSRQKSYRKNRD